MTRFRTSVSLLVLGPLLTLAACTNKDGDRGPTLASASAEAVSTPDPVFIDGSSTVFPISKSVLAMYASRLVTDIKVDGHGTGAGFEKFCRNQTSINGASRPISLPEQKLCETNHVKFMELPIAFDGIAVVVSKQNKFLHEMTVAELKRLWEPAAEGTVMQWRDLRRTLPDERIELAGPGLESGTFDFFTMAVVGMEHGSRSDYKASGDDEVLVDYVAERPNALGYFGLSYYAKNKRRLRALAIDDGNDQNGEGFIEPSAQSVNDATYQPLARPLFIYVNVDEAERAEVRDFVAFYLRAARLVAPDVGYVGLPERAFELAQRRFAQRQIGSVFDGEPIIGLTIEELLSAETVEVLGKQADARTTAVEE